MLRLEVITLKSDGLQMLWRVISRLSQLAVIGSVLVPGAAYATCTLPNNLTNGQTTDATQVMGNFSALSSCLDSNGSVSTGSAGQLGVYNSSGNQISGQSLSNILDSNIGSTQGTIIYRGASGWQALAPGAAHNVLSTNGPGADPAWVPQSGGGGGGKTWAFPNGTGSWSVSAATSMNVVHIATAMSVSDLAALFNPVTGGTYKMGLASWDRVTLKITSAPVYTPSQTVATGGLGIPLYFSFSTPVSLVPGDYAVMLIRTDGSPTTSMSLLFGGGAFWAPQVSMSSSNTEYSVANQAPTTSDVWASQGNGWWNFALMYSY
jgi:hypothetical protein